MQAAQIDPTVEGQWKLGERLGQRESAEGALAVLAVLAVSLKGELRTGFANEPCQGHHSSIYSGCIKSNRFVEIKMFHGSLDYDVIERLPRVFQVLPEEFGIRICEIEAYAHLQDSQRREDRKVLSQPCNQHRCNIMKPIAGDSIHIQDCFQETICLDMLAKHVIVYVNSISTL